MSIAKEIFLIFFNIHHFWRPAIFLQEKMCGSPLQRIISRFYKTKHEVMPTPFPLTLISLCAQIGHDDTIQDALDV